MRRMLLVIGLALAGFLSVPMAAAAATSPAQIVNCSTSTWCYSPNPMQVTVGTSVTWANGTVAPHTATSDSGAWNTGTIAAGGTSAAITFNTAGTFTYHCNFHSFMHGTIVVTAAASASPGTTTSAAPTATPHATTHVLAQSGIGPNPLIGLLAVLLGLALLASRGLRRQGPQAARQPVDKTTQQ